MTKIEELSERLKSTNRRLVGFTGGTNPNTTPEQVAAEILKVLDHIDAGNYEEVTTVDRDDN